MNGYEKDQETTVTVIPQAKLKRAEGNTRQANVYLPVEGIFEQRKAPPLDVRPYAAPDTSFGVLDGMRRLLAARRDGIKTIECRVHWYLQDLPSGHPLEWAIGYALGHEKKPIKAFAGFMARVNAEQEPAHSIAELVHKAGLRLSDKQGPGAIACTAALERIWGSGLVAPVLFYTTKAWPQESDAQHQYVVWGIAHFVAAYGERVDGGHLLSALRKTLPARIVRDMKGRLALTPDTLAEAAQGVIEAVYNRGLGEDRRLLGTPPTKMAGQGGRVRGVRGGSERYRRIDRRP
jgi:hypothetical protein